MHPERPATGQHDEGDDAQHQRERRQHERHQLAERHVDEPAQRGRPRPLAGRTGGVGREAAAQERRVHGSGNLEMAFNLHTAYAKSRRGSASGWE